MPICIHLFLFSKYSSKSFRWVSHTKANGPPPDIFLVTKASIDCIAAETRKSGEAGERCLLLLRIRALLRSRPFTARSIAKVSVYSCKLPACKYWNTLSHFFFIYIEEFSRLKDGECGNQQIFKDIIQRNPHCTAIISLELFDKF